MTGDETGRLFSVYLGTGFGLGMAYAEGSRLLATTHDQVLRDALDTLDTQHATRSSNDKNVVSIKTTDSDK